MVVAVQIWSSWLGYVLLAVGMINRHSFQIDRAVGNSFRNR